MQDSSSIIWLTEQYRKQGKTNLQALSLHQLMPLGPVLETKVPTFSPDRGGQGCDSTTV